MRVKSLELVKGGGNGLRDADSRIPAALRLLHAERSDEIFPILMEEIVRLGYSRAFVLSADFETGAVSPVAGIKCSDSYLQKFRTSLYSDHPVIGVFHSLNPDIISRS